MLWSVVGGPNNTMKPDNPESAAQQSPDIGTLQVAALQILSLDDGKRRYISWASIRDS